jgi:hypothetical protein
LAPSKNASSGMPNDKKNISCRTGNGVAAKKSSVNIFLI